MEEEIIYTEKWAVFPTLEEYNSLNDQIGDSYEYPRNLTSFYSDPNPLPEWDGNYYMRITTDVQEFHADCLQGIELIDSVPIEIIPEP